ncbi:GMC family oxidoreductase N-terminal domain-containing protein [Mumia sp. zg.B53]|uniref:GMC family oxidoreductase n=1 Tax=Mumia sp. zg.B53 TaxID=2855449 RepID=UPI001C6EE0E4|nr:GMC family oxidoreductase N-terminal domain-containing protein [Mumia sp. zg.B53]MBW9214022.1 GMC family oxidoreductase N-terminal domain-containing protein [Mumia sp. zg.B53]
MTSYDYVVVGAGSAGAVVAARLTEDPSVTVLLLEAGPPADADEIRIPAAFSTLFKTRWDWNYTTTAQKQLHGRRAYWPRMKALGGCSSMNAMIYIRGNALDYDTWRDAYGADGWGYEDVLPYFVRAEGNTRLSGPYHGTDGPLRVEDRVFTHELTAAWVDSAVDSGFASNDDFNGASQEGAGLYQVTCRKGRRWSVVDAYLQPAMDRPNLTVLTGALATRVVVEDGRATGVAYAVAGTEQVARAEREVVLSGGAVNSPQLLMLSGIGPATHLREHGIDVVADLPGVGANLQDHPAVPLIWTTRGSTDLVQSSTLANLLRWKATGTGPLASNLGEAGAFFSSRDGLAAPDLQVHAAPSGFYDNGLREPQAQMFTAASTLVNVASRGSLRLRSADPTWHPEIDAAYYDDQTDLDAQLAGVRRVLDTVSSGPLARFLVDLWMPKARGAVPTDTELVEHIRTMSQTLFHPVGTCAMGSGESSVVDPELRVRGVDGLRVADASVMPMVPRGNTNAPAIMVGEKAADLMRGRTLPPARVAAATAAV